MYLEDIRCYKNLCIRLLYTGLLGLLVLFIAEGQTDVYRPSLELVRRLPYSPNALNLFATIPIPELAKYLCFALLFVSAILCVTKQSIYFNEPHELVTIDTYVLGSRVNRLSIHKSKFSYIAVDCRETGFFSLLHWIEYRTLLYLDSGKYIPITDWLPGSAKTATEAANFASDFLAIKRYDNDLNHSLQTELDTNGNLILKKGSLLKSFRLVEIVGLTIILSSVFLQFYVESLLNRHRRETSPLWKHKNEHTIPSCKFYLGDWPSVKRFGTNTEGRIVAKTIKPVWAVCTVHWKPLPPIPVDRDKLQQLIKDFALDCTVDAASQLNDDLSEVNRREIGLKSTFEKPARKIVFRITRVIEITHRKRCIGKIRVFFNDPNDGLFAITCIQIRGRQDFLPWYLFTMPKYSLDKKARWRGKLCL